MGGARGHLLTSSVRAVHADFLLAAQRFQQVRAAPARQLQCQLRSAVDGASVVGGAGSKQKGLVETWQPCQPSSTTFNDGCSSALLLCTLCSWITMFWM